MLGSIPESFSRKVSTYFSLWVMCRFAGRFRLLYKWLFLKNYVIKVFICLFENSNFIVLWIKVFEKRNGLHFLFWANTFERTMFVHTSNLCFIFYLHFLKLFIHKRVQSLVWLFDFLLLVLLQHWSRRNMNGKIIINGRFCLMFH